MGGGFQKIGQNNKKLVKGVAPRPSYPPRHAHRTAPAAPRPLRRAGPQLKTSFFAKKISIGKMNKFKEENSLLTQAWVMEPKKKVQDILKELAVNDLKIKEFSRIKIGE